MCSYFDRIVDLDLGQYFVDKIIFDEQIDLDFDNVVEVELDNFGDDDYYHFVMRNYFFFDRNLVVVGHAIYVRNRCFCFDFDDDAVADEADDTDSFVDFVQDYFDEVDFDFA